MGCFVHLSGRRRRYRRPQSVFAALAASLCFVSVAAASGLGSLGSALVSPLAHAPCVRLFHSGGDVGCRVTEPGGVTLPLFGISDASHIAEFETEASGTVVAAVLPPSFFNSSVLTRLEATGRLGGVLLLEGDQAAPELARQAGAAFSPAVLTPQGDLTPSAGVDVDPSYQWNRHGNGLLMESRAYPIALLQGETANQQAAEWGEFNREHGVASFPRHSAQMSFYFGPSGLNSADCLGWTDMDGKLEPQCLPLGGQSAWAVAGAPVGAKPLVLLTAAMDGNSAFHDASASVNGAASGLAAVLAAAEALATAAEAGSIDVGVLARQIGFAAFQADAWGFTGSRRFVSDALGAGIDCQNRIEASKAPAGLEACLDPIYPSLEFARLGGKGGSDGVAAVLAVDQVGVLAEPERLFLHKSSGASDADAATAIAAGSALPGGFAATAAAAARGALPPTPLTAFVHADKSTTGFVLAGYDGSFANPAYQSHWDTVADVTAVTAAATAAARMAYRLAGGDSASSAEISANSTLVGEILACLAGSSSGGETAGKCSLAGQYIAGEMANTANLVGETVFLPSLEATSSYTGVLSPWDGGGLPVLQRAAKNGAAAYFSRAAGEFDAGGGDRLRMVPSAREMFVRAFLAEQAARSAGPVIGFGGKEGAACATSGDCPGAGSCPAVGAAALMECVVGRCVCPLAHYHLAMDVGLRRTETPDVFDIVDSKSPLWAEPNWGKIGVRAYVDPGRGVGGAAVVMGLLVAMLAGVGSQILYGALAKSKLV